MVEWNFLDTAPVDGDCLVWCDTDDGGEMMILYRDKKGNWLYQGEPTFCCSVRITPVAWARKPNPPSDELIAFVLKYEL